METLILTFLLFIFGTVCAAAGYASGHRDGKREGYASGRNISRARSAAFDASFPQMSFWCGDCGRYTLTDHSSLDTHTMDTVK